MDKITFEELTVSNMNDCAVLFMDYFNKEEGASWDYEKAYRRIHQIITKEDSLSVKIIVDGVLVGFEMGYLTQYEDGLVFDLYEVIVKKDCQRKGYGKALVEEAMRRAKEQGAFLCELTAVNDEAHDKFYGSMNINDCTNLKLKSRII